MVRIVAFALSCIGIAFCALGAQSERNMDPENVIGKTWQWEMTATPAEKITVPNPERYTILFGSEGRLQARFDCNRGSGDYKMSDGKLSFGPMMSTRAACPPDSLDVSFMRDLERVTSFYVEKGKLYLELSSDGGTMCLRPAP